LADLDELCPPFVGEERISLSVAPDAIIRAHANLDVFVSYGAVGPSGLVLPLDLILAPPTVDNRTVRTFRRFVPQSLVVRIDEPGTHLLILRERFHNRWWGRLTITAQEA
jgi:hypothetical protein